ncbi:MAG: hypothetical protein IIA89_07680 [Chloroflexi bacterium]|nr:hypothetical protein [Chloroflexota bacterium]
MAKDGKKMAGLAVAEPEANIDGARTMIRGRLRDLTDTLRLWAGDFRSQERSMAEAEALMMANKVEGLREAYIAEHYRDLQKA